MRQGDRCLVTGGAGFIGSNLVRALLARGMQVRVFDDFSTGRRQNLHDIQLDIDLIEGDLRDPGRVHRAMQDVAVVFHHAAVPSVARSVADPIASHAANATGTLNALVAARGAGVERFVYASSSSVYGFAEYLPLDETMPCRPISPYGVSKLAGENYLFAFSRTYGMPAISLRFFNVYGPRQNPDLEYAAVVPRFISAALDGRPVTIYGDGEQVRDFTFVGDVIAANLLAADAGPDTFGHAFNIAYGQRRTVNQLFEAIGSLAPRETAPPVYADPRPGDVKASAADISRARAALGFEPAYPLEEGLRITMEWFASGKPWVAV